MTNNQREFQKQIERLQREMKKLSRSNLQLPRQPKRITQHTLNEISNLHAKDLPEVIPTLKSESTKLEPKRPRNNEIEPNLEHHARHSTKSEYVRHPRVRHEPKEQPKKVKHTSWLEEQEPKTRKTRSDKGIKRGKVIATRKPPVPSGKPRKARKDKGIKRGALSPEESKRRTTKRLETLSKSTKPRKTRKDKGTHLTAEEKAKRNAKRLETIAKKKRPTTPEYGNDFIPTFNAVDTLIDRFNEAKSSIIENQPMQSYGRQVQRSVRIRFLDSLIDLVNSYASQEEFYKQVWEERSAEISDNINTIQYDSDEDDVENAFVLLYALLSPVALPLEELKRISDEVEYYNESIY